MGSAGKKAANAVASVITLGVYDVAKGDKPFAGVTDAVKSGEKTQQSSPAQNTTAPAQSTMGGKPETVDTGEVTRRRTRGRTQTVFTNTLGIGGMASTARKTLLGM
jgi:hypothetical protein